MKLNLNFRRYSYEKYKNVDFISEEGYVCAFFDDKTVELLFIYDMSKLCFYEKEFIGLTKDEALKLYLERQEKVC